MDYKKSFDIYEFEFWSGAKGTIEQVERLDLMNELQGVIEENFMMDNEIPSDTQINEFVWFEDDFIGQMLGVNLYED